MSANDALEEFGVTEERGLTEREVAKRAQRYGRNAFTEAKEKGIIARMALQLKSPLTLILVGACLLTFALQEYIDAAVILFALSLAVAVGVLQEGRASRAFKKLADSQAHTATVIRGGKKHEVDATLLVPGDIVELSGGMQVPADIRLVAAKKLTIDKSALTGEWLPAKKRADKLPVGTAFSDRMNMVWKGTYAVSGACIGMVVATGDRTELGALAKSLHAIEEEKTPLQTEMEQVSKVMFGIVAAITILIFAVGVYEERSLIDMLLLSVAIAVASVPEGLPAAVTIVLAVGMETLLKRGGLVRNLLAAETLGSTTHVLTDKTGTLTVAKMAVTGVIRGETLNAAPSSWHEDAGIREMLDVALAASDAYVDEVKGARILRGDAVECAILEAALELGLSPSNNALRAHRRDFLAFTSENRFAAGLVETKEGRRLCVNGAPEYLLSLARSMHEENGVRTLSTKDREAYLASILAETKKGRRLIGVAYRDVAYGEIPEDKEPESLLKRELTFLGVLVLNDPVRKNVGAAIRGVQDAGARVILITGDNPQTALSVARAVGIADNSDTAVTGDELADLSDEDLADLIEEVSVFARILPNQKMRIAEILQKQGHIVAMTGDGVNDAPALRRANIGIAVGSGTEVAKEASDLVLIDDSFAIIYAAIEEGRRIISNLRKIVGYLLSTSLAEVVLISAALVTGAAAPLVPAQILFANIIEEGLMSFAFAFERGERNAMKRRPQDIHAEGILSSAMLKFMLLVVSVHGALLLALYFFLQSLSLPIEEMRSTMFLVIAVDSLFMAFAFRSLETPIWKIPVRGNLFFYGSFALSAGLLAIVLAVPFLREFLSYEPLPMRDILLVIGFSFSILMIVEASKFLFFERRREVVE